MVIEERFKKEPGSNFFFPYKIWCELQRAARRVVEEGTIMFKSNLDRDIDQKGLEGCGQHITHLHNLAGMGVGLKHHNFMFLHCWRICILK